MEEIRSHWHIPSIAHYCKLFRKAFKLPHFNFEDLEFAFLLKVSLESDETNSVSSQTNLLRNLIVSLLKGIFKHFTVNILNWESFLRKLFRIEKKKSPFITYVNGDEQIVSFDDLPLRTRIEIVYNLCEYRLLREESRELFKYVDANECRIEPLGKDSKGYVYWYFYGTRLYRENPTVADEIESKLKKIEEFKRRDEEIQRKAVDTKKRADEERIRRDRFEEKQICSTREIPKLKRELQPKVSGCRIGLRERNVILNDVCKITTKIISSKSVNPKKSFLSNVKTKSLSSIPVITLDKLQEAWSLICITENDWIELHKKLKNSKSECEIELGNRLYTNFISVFSEILEKVSIENRMIKRIEKQNSIRLLPRRTSKRLRITTESKEQNICPEKVRKRLGM